MRTVCVALYTACTTAQLHFAFAWRRTGFSKPPAFPCGERSSPAARRDPGTLQQCTVETVNKGVQTLILRVAARPPFRQLSTRSTLLRQTSKSAQQYNVINNLLAHLPYCLQQPINTMFSYLYINPEKGKARVWLFELAVDDKNGCYGSRMYESTCHEGSKKAAVVVTLERFA